MRTNFYQKYVILWFVILACNCLADHSLANEIEKRKLMVCSELVSRSSVVIRAKLLSPGEGSKYLWAELQVLEVIKNDSSIKIGNSLKAAYIPSENPTILPEEFIAYLEPYNKKMLKFFNDSLHEGTNSKFTK